MENGQSTLDSYFEDMMTAYKTCVSGSDDPGSIYNQLYTLERVRPQIMMTAEDETPGMAYPPLRMKINQ
jgi:hypothetical protein